MREEGKGYILPESVEEDIVRGVLPTARMRGAVRDCWRAVVRRAVAIVLVVVREGM